MTRTKIKICCINSPDEARLAIRLGADALRLVGQMPSGLATFDWRLFSGRFVDKLQFNYG